MIDAIRNLLSSSEIDAAERAEAAARSAAKKADQAKRRAYDRAIAEASAGGLAQRAALRAGVVDLRAALLELGPEPPPPELSNSTDLEAIHAHARALASHDTTIETHRAARRAAGMRFAYFARALRAAETSYRASLREHGLSDPAIEPMLRDDQRRPREGQPCAALTHERNDVLESIAIRAASADPDLLDYLDQYLDLLDSAAPEPPPTRDNIYQPGGETREERMRLLFGHSGASRT